MDKLGQLCNCSLPYVIIYKLQIIETQLKRDIVKNGVEAIVIDEN